MPKQKNHTFQGLTLKGKKKGKRAQKMPLCSYGAGCRRKGCMYRHPPKLKNGEVAPTNTSGTVCTHFLAGYCAWGKGCRNIHPSENVRVVPTHPPQYTDTGNYYETPQYLETFSRVAPAGFGGVGAGYGHVQVIHSPAIQNQQQIQQQQHPFYYQNMVSTQNAGRGLGNISSNNMSSIPNTGSNIGRGRGNISSNSHEWFPTFNNVSVGSSEYTIPSSRSNETNELTTPPIQSSNMQSSYQHELEHMAHVADTRAIEYQPIMQAILKDYTITEQERQKRIRDVQDGSLSSVLFNEYSQTMSTVLEKSSQSVYNTKEIPNVTNELSIVNNNEMISNELSIVSKDEMISVVGKCVESTYLGNETVSSLSRSKLSMMCFELIENSDLLCDLGFITTMDMFMPQLSTSTNVHPSMLLYLIQNILLNVLDPNNSNDISKSDCDIRKKLYKVISQEIVPSPDYATIRYNVEQETFSNDLIVNQIKHMNITRSPIENSVSNVSIENNTKQNKSFGMAAMLKQDINRVQEKGVISENLNRVQEKGVISENVSTKTLTLLPSRVPISKPDESKKLESYENNVNESKEMNKNLESHENNLNEPKEMNKKTKSNSWTKVERKNLKSKSLSNTNTYPGSEVQYDVQKPRSFVTAGKCTDGNGKFVSEVPGAKPVWVETGAAALKDYNAGGFRKDAVENHHAMEKCFTAAVEAYRRGNGAAAARHAKQGKIYKRKMEESHAKASEEIFSIRSKAIPDSLKSTTIDLHVRYLSSIPFFLFDTKFCT